MFLYLAAPHLRCNTQNLQLRHQDLLTVACRIHLRKPGSKPTCLPACPLGPQSPSHRTPPSPHPHPREVPRILNFYPVHLSPLFL